MKHRNRFFAFFLALSCAMTGLLAGASEAGVTLKGYNTSNAYDYVSFGRYPGSFISSVNDGVLSGAEGVDWVIAPRVDDGNWYYRIEPIVWRVLSADQAAPRKALIWSDHMLDNGIKFNDGVTFGWGDGISLWKWLNTEYGTTFADSSFLKNAFTGSEQRSIADHDQMTQTYTLPVTYFYTTDKVFILSNEELRTTSYGFLDSVNADPGRAINPADYAYKIRLYAYWARSMGGDYTKASLVGSEGELRELGDHVDSTRYGVRPACFLNLESFIFKSALSSVSLPRVAGGGSADNPWELYTPLAPSPTLSVETDGKLKLAFASAVDSVDLWPLSQDFTLATPSGTIGKVEATVGGTFILLSPDVLLTVGSTVKLAYILSVDAIGGMLLGGAVVKQGTTEAMGSDEWTATVPIPSQPDPVDPDPIPQSIVDLLKALSASLSPNASVAVLPLTDATRQALAAKGYTNPVPVTQVPEGANPFIKKNAPDAPLPNGYTGALRPSFTATLNLSGNTGNMLALSLSFNVVSLEGCGAWGTLADPARAGLLDDKKLTLACEYADQTWKILLPDGELTWAKALELKIVQFTPTGLTFNYAVLNGTGDPFVAGSLLAIPDGANDGQLRDPVWLLASKVVPTALTLTPSPLTLKVGESAAVKVTFIPADATERDLLWTVGDSTLVSVTKATAADTWTVKGLAGGITSLSVTAGADRRVTSPLLTVTVLPVETDLIESLTVSPLPPYHAGEEVEVLAKLKRAASAVTATIQRPDGRTDTPTVNVDGTSAWLSYTLPEPGSYTVTVKATDATTGTPWERTATLTVTEDSVKKDGGSGGGCNAGVGLLALALGAVLLKRR